VAYMKKFTRKLPEKE